MKSNQFTAESDEDDDEYDDFFFQSIPRYNTLHMFNLENIPYHLLPLNETSVCVVNKRVHGHNSELLKLHIPPKLFLPPQDDGTSKENDFEVVSGLYADGIVHQIDKILLENAIILSENDISGLQVYKFTDRLLENKAEPHKLNVPNWNASNFAVIKNSKHVLCSKCYHEPLIQVDIEVGQKIGEIKHPFHQEFHHASFPGKSDTSSHFTAKSDTSTHFAGKSDTSNHVRGKSDTSAHFAGKSDTSSHLTACHTNDLKCKSLTHHTFAVLNSYTGDVTLHDLRNNEEFIHLPGISSKHQREIWTFSGSDFLEGSHHYMGLLSDKKSFYIYDMRNNGIVIQQISNLFPTEHLDNLKLKFNQDQSKFSISGTNAFVEVYRLHSDHIQPIFTHNGHCPKNLASCFVTDHIWQKTHNREFVISICDNKTLNCWDCKT